MPGLVAFNRRWSIGSDDLVVPSFVEICGRTALLIVISVIFHVHRDSLSCEDGTLLKIYYIGTLVLLSVSIVNAAGIMYIGMKGTIMNIAPRKKIPLLLYIKVAIMVPEIVWIILGTYWAFGKSYGCEKHVVWTVRGAVICAWCAGVLFVIGLLIVFDPLGSSHYRKRAHTDMAEHHETAYKVWETRCRLLCCCVSCKNDNKDAFSEIAKLVAEFFQDIDLVPTDIAAGLILVEQEQRQREGNIPAIIVDGSVSEGVRHLQHNGPGQAGDGQSSSSSVMTALSQPKSWMNIKLINHYLKFAIASYGWPFYMYNNLTTGLCQLITKCRCCSCVRQQGNVIHDNTCECNTAAVRRLTGVQEQDLIYTSFHNKLKEIPFYVAIDRENRAVVIGIRGTLSLEDALTDMDAKGTCMPVPGVADSYVHGGMLECASYIKSCLQAHHLLERAFEALGEDGRLVITGHSLGAGVAAILSVQLQQDHPNLICFAFSPPGGLMSSSLSSYAEDFICSVLVGKDIVPRLGMPTMLDLKTKVLQALSDTDLPKHRILAGGCLRLLCGCFAKLQDQSANQRERPLLNSGGSSGSYTTGAPQQAPVNSLFRNIQEAISDTLTAKKQAEQSWPMHMPGQILHIIESEGSSVCIGDPDYYALWAAPGDFNEILIGHRMVLDHFPDVVLRATQQLDRKNYVPRARRMSEFGPQTC